MTAGNAALATARLSSPGVSPETALMSVIIFMVFALFVGVWSWLLQLRSQIGDPGGTKWFHY